jgi:hypothetical protein
VVEEWDMLWEQKVSWQLLKKKSMPVLPRMNEIPDRKRLGGFVPPIGIKERADDIPAMLSNNEFVFTAERCAKNAGGGDVKS